MENNLFISIFSSTHPPPPDIKWSAPYHGVMRQNIYEYIDIITWPM